MCMHPNFIGTLCACERWWWWWWWEKNVPFIRFDAQHFNTKSMLTEIKNQIHFHCHKNCTEPCTNWFPFFEIDFSFSLKFLLFFCVFFFRNVKRTFLVASLNQWICIQNHMRMCVHVYVMEINTFHSLYYLKYFYAIETEHIYI